MALSDACSEFLEAVRVAAEGLAKNTERCAPPDYPIHYGVEVDALRRACADVVESPDDPEAGAHLLRLAASVMRYHATPSGMPELAERQAEMTSLIRKKLGL